MKYKKVIFTTIVLLLSAMFATVAAKAFFDTHASKNPTLEIAVPVTAIPEEICDSDIIAQVTKEVTEIATPLLTVTETHLPPEPIEATETYLPPEPIEATEASEHMEQMETTIAISPTSMENTLFIGDSRTVGLSEYAQMDGADFFASVGTGVFGIDKVELSISPDTDKETLSELLQKRQYDRIYIMLGINELGYPFEMLVQKYRDFIQSVQSTQPDSMIFALANLHVTKSRSDRDKVINNSAINALNEAISALADNEHIFYLDANCIFDDANGALDEEKSGDAAHPLAKYYQEWGNWIAEQTGILLSQRTGGA